MEWFNEIFGLLIVIFVFIFPLLRKLLLKKRGQPKDEEIEIDEEEEEYEIENISLPPAAQRPPRRPTTERLVKKDFEFHAGIEDRELTSKIETRKFETHIAPTFKDRIVSESFILTPVKKMKRQQFINRLTKRRDPLQSMVILSEIFKPPKSLE